MSTVTVVVASLMFLFWLLGGLLSPSWLMEECESVLLISCSSCVTFEETRIFDVSCWNLFWALVNFSIPAKKYVDDAPRFSGELLSSSG